MGGGASVISQSHVPLLIKDLLTSGQRLRVPEYPKIACLSVRAICYLHLLQFKTSPDL